jgi:hypothetical protein
MAGSWVMVNRNPYLSGSQKLVQARMYAQGGTLAALLASFALEGADAAKGQGRWETIKVVDPNDPEHKHVIEKRIHHERYAGEDQWRGKKCPCVIRLGGAWSGWNDRVLMFGTEMIEAEEERLKERNAHIEAKREHPEDKKKQESAQKEKKEAKDKSGATH